MALVESIEIELKGKGIDSLIEALNKLADACKNVSNVARKVADTTKEVTDVTNQQAESFARSKNELELLKMKYQGAVEQLARMMSKEKERSDLIANQVQKVQKLAKAIEDYGKEQDKSSKKSSKLLSSLKNIGKGFSSLLRSLGRIAFYRLIRIAIKGITDAFSEGLENAYHFSELIGGDLAKSLDSMASANEKLKNQLGAAWGTLLQAVMPWLLKIIDALTVAADKVTQFFALLSGQSGYLKAKDVTKKWAEDTEKGAEAAKEWKNQLLGFDEINRLDDTRSSGSSNNDATDYGDLYEWVELEPWTEKIRNALNNIGDWITDLWRKLHDTLVHLRDKVKEIFDAISETVKAKIQEMIGSFQIAFETVKNGCITAKEKVEEFTLTTLSTVKSWVAQMQQQFETFKITTVQTVSSWVAEMKQKFEEFKVSSLQTVSSFIAEFNNQLIAMKSTTVSAVNDIISAVKSAIEQFRSNTLPAIQQWIIDVENKIQSSQIGQRLAENIKSGVETAKEILDGLIQSVEKAFKELGNAIGTTIKEAVNNMVESISSGLKNVWNSVSSMVQSLGGKIATAWNSTGARTYTDSNGIKTLDLTTSKAQSVLNLVFGKSLGGIAAVPAFANGGTPASGSLFLAGERGAELISTAGGSTTVSNSDQIASSVANGNTNVVNAILSMANAIVSAVDSKDMNTYLDGKEIAYGIHKYNNTVSKNYGRNLVSIT